MQHERSLKHRLCSVPGRKGQHRDMRAFWLCISSFSFFFCFLLDLTSGVPVKFPVEESRVQPIQRSSSYERSPEESGRIFHQHALKKKRKKKLLQCLLGGRSYAPKPQESRTFFVNIFQLDFDQHGGGGPSNDFPSGGGSSCHGLGNLGGLGGLGSLGGLGGGSNGGDGGDDDDDDDDDESDDSPSSIGGGINNLSSFVGQAPANIITSVGDNIKPVFENPERYLNRYVFRPLYKSLRPFYRLF